MQLSRSTLALSVLLPLALPLLAGGCASSPAVEAPRRYPGFAGYERAVRTGSPDAQAWFDQGIQLLYGFNHDEAIRSFQAATQADPDCLMAWWGIAYSAGVDINNPDMTPEEQELAVDAAAEAERCAALPDADPLEAALARAVAARYAYPSPEDRTHLDRAYADAMQRAHELFPDDHDVGVVFADALMNLQPWDYWTQDGEPKGRTLEVVAALEHVLALDPVHPGANHFLIHALEASPDPARAEAAADRLQALVPGSGHLVHMPSHVYVRVGRYADASDANERAIAADRAYFELAPPPGFYSLYFVHNIHMLAFAAMMEGRYATAMEAGRALDAEVPADFLRDYAAFADGLMATPLHVMIRFGRWEDVLAVPEPAEFRKMSRAMRHYARGVALSALGRVAEARAEEARFEAAAAEVPEDWKVGNNDAAEVLALARHMLQGEILYREGRHDEAFRVLRAGVALEDALVYDEPPGWMQPIRHALGALLLGAGRAAEAEEVYRQDLVEHPENGWSLLGLETALARQERGAEAAPLRVRREEAWRRADVTPASSCYCEPGTVAVDLR
jgi:tetratricopeptide (TPR) repeat protein